MPVLNVQIIVKIVLMKRIAINVIRIIYWYQDYVRHAKKLLLIVNIVHMKILVKFVRIDFILIKIIFAVNALKIANIAPIQAIAAFAIPDFIKN